MLRAPAAELARLFEPALTVERFREGPGLRRKVAVFSQFVVQLARRAEDRFGNFILPDGHLSPRADRIAHADEDSRYMELFVARPSTRQQFTGLCELPLHRNEPAEEDKDSCRAHTIRGRLTYKLLASTDRFRSGNRAVIQRGRDLRTADRRRPSRALVVLHSALLRLGPRRHLAVHPAVDVADQEPRTRERTIVAALLEDGNPSARQL